MKILKLSLSALVVLVALQSPAVASTTSTDHDGYTLLLHVPPEASAASVLDLSGIQLFLSDDLPEKTGVDTYTIWQKIVTNPDANGRKKNSSGIWTGFAESYSCKMVLKEYNLRRRMVRTLQVTEYNDAGEVIPMLAEFKLNTWSYVIPETVDAGIVETLKKRVKYKP